MSVKVGSLNLVNLSDTGTERFPISGPNDPGVLLSVLGFWVSKVTRVGVEYASASNQASVISAAITAATAGDCLAFGHGVVKIETAIAQTKKLFWRGQGTIFRTTSNISILTLSTSSANESDIQGITFEGNNTGAAQMGLVTSSVSGFKVRNCNFSSFNVAGMQIGAASNTTPYRLNQITDCWAFSCTNGIGFNVLATGEYCTFSSCGSFGNLTGWKIAAGNFTLQGCTGTGCTTGFLVDSGANNGHGTVSGGAFNHNTTNINVNALTTGNGICFMGVQAFSGNIIFNDDVVTWTGGQISATTITVSNCDRALFNGTIIHGTPTIAGTSIANIVWANCYTNAGVAYNG